MKQIHKEKLQFDLIKYCKQIGILPEDTPQLATDRYQLYDLLMKKTGNPFLAIDEYYKYKSVAGSYFYKLKIIYVNTHQKYLINRQTLKRTRKVIQYTDFLWCLIHELVHCRIGEEFKHGPEFDHRIKEVLSGKTFSPIPIGMSEIKKV